MQLSNFSLQLSQITISTVFSLYFQSFIRRMNEYFLHTVWNHQTFIPYNLKTANGKTLIIHQKGIYNHTNGPDFKSAEISIDKKKLNGDIEIHIKSSDWVNHKHHIDDAYDNVILHVVFDHDKAVFKKNGGPIETLVLKHRINLALAQTVQNKKDLICSGNSLIASTWQEQSSRSLGLRYTKKKLAISQLSEREFHGDWWLTAFWLLLKAYLGNHNGELALPITKHIQKRILLTCTNPSEMTIYLLGTANLLEKLSKQEKQLYNSIKFKYQLSASPVIGWKYKEVRPSSFPEIRIRQFANWIFHNRNKLDLWFKENVTVDEFRISLVFPNDITKSHPLGESKINEIIINGFLLLQFCRGNSNHSLELLSKNLSKLPSETNAISRKFHKLIPPVKTALDSQQTISQYQEFCVIKNCLNCLIGCEVLGRTSIK